MSVVIDDQTIQIRVQFMELEKQKLEKLLAKTEDNKEFATISREIYAIEKVLEELDDWLKIINRDPGWGELVNIGGRRIPKLPSFSSEDELKWRMSNPDKHWVADMTEEQTAAAREFNARNNAADAIDAMDGQGPIAALEGEGKSADEIVEDLRKEWEPWRSETTPPSKSES